MTPLGLRTNVEAASDLRTRQEGLYERDFYAWTVEQAERLRARARSDNAGDIDWTHAAEEIESLGARERREIRSRMAVLLQHLLKWRFQAIAQSESWRATIAEQRDQIGETLADSPSLGSFPSEVLPWAYPRAVRAAARETGLPETAFPAVCPFALDEILDPAFFPEAA